MSRLLCLNVDSCVELVTATYRSLSGDRLFDSGQRYSVPVLALTVLRRAGRAAADKRRSH